MKNMTSLDANNETVNSSSSNQPGSAENSHSPSVQYDAVARHQQCEGIVDTGYEQLIAQYEAVHNNTLEHASKVATRVNQLESRSTAESWVNNVDEDRYSQVPNDQQSALFNTDRYLQVPNDQQSALFNTDRYLQVPNDQQSALFNADRYLQVPNDQQSVPFNAGRCMQVLNGDDVAVFKQSGNFNQRVRQVARVDSFGYLQPVVNSDADVYALPTVSLNINGVIAAESDTSNQLSSLNTAQDQGDTRSNPLYTRQDGTPPNLLRTAQSHEKRPGLPNPRVNNQPTSDITFFNSTMPFRLRFLTQFVI
jgi:hypothetical protein